MPAPKSRAKKQNGKNHHGGDYKRELARTIPKMLLIPDGQGSRAEIQRDYEEITDPKPLLLRRRRPQTISLEHAKKNDEQWIHALTPNDPRLNRDHWTLARTCNLGSQIS